MLKRSWLFISNLGIDASVDPLEHKRIKLSNQLIFYSILLTFVFIGVYAVLGFRKVNAVELQALTVYAVLLLTSGRGYYNVTRFFFIVMLNLHMFLLALCFGIDSQVQLLFIPVAAVPIVLYNRRELRLLFFGTFLSIAFFCALYTFAHSVTGLRENVDPAALPMMRFLFNFTAIICEVIVLFSIISGYDRTERRLDENNELLQQQFQSIFENSFDALFLVDWKKRLIIKANKRAKELFEMDSEEEFYTMFGPDLHAELPTEAELDKMRNALNTIGFYEGEICYKTKKGNRFWGAIAIKAVVIGKEKYQSVRVTDITVDKQAKAHVEASLHEKEILLSEIHHRVKNNMAVISGLLGLQSSYVEDHALKSLFEESRNRIHSMALIHDKLYQHETFARIDFNAYCNDLINYIRGSYDTGKTKIDYVLICADIFVDIKYAVPCGLILNELISNAHKHAFKDRSHGEIRIVCTKMGGKFTMMVSDDGIGFNAEQTLEQPVSLGLTLITALVEQVNGTLKAVNRSGTTYYISFEE